MHNILEQPLTVLTEYFDISIFSEQTIVSYHLFTVMMYCCINTHNRYLISFKKLHYSDSVALRLVVIETAYMTTIWYTMATMSIIVSASIFKNNNLHMHQS